MGDDVVIVARVAGLRDDADEADSTGTTFAQVDPGLDDFPRLEDVAFQVVTAAFQRSGLDWIRGKRRLNRASPFPRTVGSGVPPLHMDWPRQIPLLPQVQ